MTEAVATLLRCPLDPAHQSPLVREQSELVCTCGVRFPVRNGIPILVANQAELPEGCAKIQSLPCQKKRG